MTNRPKLIRLLAELDQQLAEAEGSYADVPLTISEATLRTEIVDGLRAALANVDWRLTRAHVNMIDNSCLLSDRPMRLGMSARPELSDESGIINDFIAAHDAQSTLESVLMRLQESCTDSIAEEDGGAQIDDPND